MLAKLHWVWRSSAFCVLLTILISADGLASKSVLGQTASATGSNGSAGTPANSPAIPEASLFRDPNTGAIYKQEMKSVEVPTTRWQTRLVDRTVTVPQTVVENVQIPQTVYVPQTQYVMQPKLKGAWNPFAQPTYAYEYVPVTRWLPQTQMVTKQVPTTKWIPRTEKVPVVEPVQTTEKVQQAVVSLVQPGQGLANQTLANASVPAYQPIQPASAVATGRPLIGTLPILSQQRVLPTWQPGTLLSMPAATFRTIASAPAMSSSGSQYRAPMTVATRPANSWNRDSNQSGMAPTLVR